MRATFVPPGPWMLMMIVAPSRPSIVTIGCAPAGATVASAPAKHRNATARARMRCMANPPVSAVPPFLCPFAPQSTRRTPGKEAPIERVFAAGALLPWGDTPAGSATVARGGGGARVQVAVGLFGYQNFFGGNLAKAGDFARMAEGEGIDLVSITDHVAMGPRTDRYPYGPFPVGPEWPWPEPMVVLSAIAAVTERIRLSMSVLIAPLRSAALLAKQAATLDAISGGRLDLGVGVGWQEEEYLASGIPVE